MVIAACKLLLFVLFDFCSCCLLVVVVVVMCPKMFGDFLSHLQKASVVSMCGAAAADATNTAHLHLVSVQWCGCCDADD